MPLEALKYIYDIRVSAEKIDRFIAGKNLESYLADEMLQSAIERQFEIIGEAVNSLLRHSPEIARQVPDYRKMISFRNRLS